MGRDEKIPSTLTDKHGQSYHLCVDANDERDFDLTIELDGWDVGYIYCIISPPGEMWIADFQMRDWSILRRRYWVRLLRKLRGQKEVYRNFRQLGLGTQLLDIVIAHAKRIGVQHIGGLITGPDRDNNPKLYEFYEAHGFQVTENGGHIDWYGDDR